MLDASAATNVAAVDTDIGHDGADPDGKGARLYAEALAAALAGFLSNLESAYWERQGLAPGQYPHVEFATEVILPLPSGEVVAHMANVSYNWYGGQVAPDEVHVYYGGELDAGTPQHYRHGHVVAYRSDGSWRVVWWLSPGWLGQRMILMRDSGG